MLKYFIFKNFSTSWQQLLVWPKTQRFGHDDPASVQKGPEIMCCPFGAISCSSVQLHHKVNIWHRAKLTVGYCSGEGMQDWDSILLGGILIHDKDKQKEQTPAEAIRQVATANSSLDDHSTSKLPPNSPTFSRSWVPASLITCECHLLLKPH